MRQKEAIANPITMIVRKMIHATKNITGKMNNNDNPVAVSATPIKTSNTHGSINKGKPMMISILTLQAACSKCI
jgi:hypothetical protein